MKLFFVLSLSLFAFVASAQKQHEFRNTEEDTTFIMKPYVFMMPDSGGVTRKQFFRNQFAV